MKELNIDEKRAEFAYEKVISIEDEEKKEYRSRARDFPSLVQDSFIKAITFYSAKKGTYTQYLSHIIEWLKFLKEDKELKFSMSLSFKSIDPLEFIKQINKLSIEEYIVIKNEVLQFSLWLKKFAETQE